MSAGATVRDAASEAASRVRAFFAAQAAAAPEHTRWEVVALRDRVLRWLARQSDAFWSEHAETSSADLTILSARSDDRARAILRSLGGRNRAATAEAAAPLTGWAADMLAEVRADLLRLRRFDERRVEAAVGIYMTIADAWAARKPGRSRSEWFESHIAGFHIGGTHVDAALPFEREALVKGTTAFLSSGLAIVYAFEHCTIDTLAHELGHICRRDLEDEDMCAAERWLGVPGGYWSDGRWVAGRWSTATEEAFARAFERFLRDGEIPIPELGPVFDTMRVWLRRIYLRVEGSEIDIPVSPAGREIFRRLLGCDEARDRAAGACEVDCLTAGSPDAPSLTPDGEKRETAGRRAGRCPRCFGTEGDCDCASRRAPAPAAEIVSSC